MKLFIKILLWVAGMLFVAYMAYPLAERGMPGVWLLSIVLAIIFYSLYCNKFVDWLLRKIK